MKSFAMNVVTTSHYCRPAMGCTAGLWPIAATTTTCSTVCCCQTTALASGQAVAPQLVGDCTQKCAMESTCCEVLHLLFQCPKLCTCPKLCLILSTAWLRSPSMLLLILNPVNKHKTRTWGYSCHRLNALSQFMTATGAPCNADSTLAGAQSHVRSRTNSCKRSLSKHAGRLFLTGC